MLCVHCKKYFLEDYGGTLCPRCDDFYFEAQEARADLIRKYRGFD